MEAAAEGVVEGQRMWWWRWSRMWDSSAVVEGVAAEVGEGWWVALMATAEVVEGGGCACGDQFLRWRTEAKRSQYSSANVST